MLLLFSMVVAAADASSGAEQVRTAGFRPSDSCMRSCLLSCVVSRVSDSAAITRLRSFVTYELALPDVLSSMYLLSPNVEVCCEGLVIVRCLTRDLPTDAAAGRTL